MTNPITPPPELIEQWMQAHSTKYDLARHAAQWGADQELGACLAYAGANGLSLTRMRAARRPKPPTLKERALAKLPEHPESMASYLSLSPGSVATIRRALESLDD